MELRDCRSNTTVAIEKQKGTPFSKVEGNLSAPTDKMAANNEAINEDIEEHASGEKSRDVILNDIWVPQSAIKTSSLRSCLFMFQNVLRLQLH